MRQSQEGRGRGTTVSRWRALVRSVPRLCTSSAVSASTSTIPAAVAIRPPHINREPTETIRRAEPIPHKQKRGGTRQEQIATRLLCDGIAVTHSSDVPWVKGIEVKAHCHALLEGGPQTGWLGVVSAARRQVPKVRDHLG